VLVIVRFTVPETDADRFREQVAAAVAALATRPGHVSSRLTRALDDPSSWALVSEWESVGAYRRALRNPEVRMVSAPVLAGGWLHGEEPTAYEVLWDDVHGPKTSDRA